jgi:hypothetical protein
MVGYLGCYCCIQHEGRNSYDNAAVHGVIDGTIT